MVGLFSRMDSGRLAPDRVQYDQTDASASNEVAAKVKEIITYADWLDPQVFFPDAHQLGFHSLRGAV
jgi:hypothetical protein